MSDYDFNILKCELDHDFDRGVTYKDLKGDHKLKWIVEVDNPNLFGAEVFKKLYINLEGTLPEGSDPIPRYGDQYAVNDFIEDTYAKNFSCKLKDPDDRFTWIVEVDYEGIDPSRPQQEERERRTKPNPLDWDPMYWVDYVEDQVPIEWASLLSAGYFTFEDPGETPGYVQIGTDKWYKAARTYFPLILRGDSGATNYEPGPVVNTAGQQTIDPITRPRFHAKLMCQRNYPTSFECLAMNAQFYEAVNSEPFLGDPPRTWRYLIAVTDKPQERDVQEQVGGTDTSAVESNIVRYNTTTVTLEYNPNTWDTFILNNGQSSFRKRNPGVSDATAAADAIKNPLDPDGLLPVLFPAVVLELKEEAFERLLDDSSSTLESSDYEPVVASEPVNLTPNGFLVSEITNIADEFYRKAIHLQYRHYTRELDFNDIPAFSELIDEYDEWLASQET